MAKKTAKKKAAKKPAAKPAKLSKAKKAAKKPANARKAAQSKGPVERRDDFGAPVTAFFSKLPAAQKQVALAAHDAILKAAPSLEHAVKWGIAQYMFPGGSMKDAEGFAIYASIKSVNLAVGRGGELAKKHPLLEGTGKSMRHVKLYSVADVESPALGAIVADAVKLVSGG